MIQTETSYCSGEKPPKSMNPRSSPTSISSPIWLQGHHKPWCDPMNAQRIADCDMRESSKPIRVNDGEFAKAEYPNKSLDDPSANSPDSHCLSISSECFTLAIIWNTYAMFWIESEGYPEKCLHLSAITKLHFRYNNNLFMPTKAWPLFFSVPRIHFDTFIRYHYKVF